jgi:hypothetical protein
MIGMDKVKLLSDSGMQPFSKTDMIDRVGIYGLVTME